VKGTAPIPLSGVLALVIGFTLLTALLLVLLATAVRASRGGYFGGKPMSSTRRWRLLTGAGLLVAAAIVGIIGWLKLSDEPLLNRQVPYLASTGIAVMILAIAGGALLVAEQMRTDDRRLDEIEDAVRALADAVAPAIEAAPRVRAARTSGTRAAAKKAPAKAS
jgi:hypothetical protein